MTPGPGLTSSLLDEGEGEHQHDERGQEQRGVDDLPAAPLDAQILAGDGPAPGPGRRPERDGWAGSATGALLVEGAQLRRARSAARRSSKTTRPRRRTTTCSATAAAASRSCVTRMTIRPAARSAMTDVAARRRRPGPGPSPARRTAAARARAAAPGPAPAAAASRGRRCAPARQRAPRPAPPGPAARRRGLRRRRKPYRLAKSRKFSWRGQIPVDARARGPRSRSGCAAPTRGPAARRPSVTAPLLGGDQGRQDAQHGRLARAVGPQHRRHLGGGKVRDTSISARWRP